MQITAKVFKILPLQSGEGKNGTWKKQDIVFETEDKFPKKVCISFWGDKFDENLFQEGLRLNVNFDVESREFNGKWYTDVKAWKLDRAEGNSTSNSPSDYIENTNPETAPPFPDSSIDDNDLPF